MKADVIDLTPYGLIDLDMDPCIFPACGHVVTVSSMDGWMDFAQHYEIDEETGDPISVKSSSAPFSSTELKTCPTCRGSLRNIARYGRIVRRALLDESAKKLTAWSNRTNSDLAERLAANQEQLLTSVDTTLKPTQDIMLNRSETEQHKAVKTSKASQRYRMVYSTRSYIQTFADKLRKEEQPYQRVRDLVETARRQNTNGKIAEFTFDESELQLREYLQATSLLVRCDIVIFSDVIRMHNKITPGTPKGALRVDFSANRARCAELVKEAQVTHSVRQEVEGHLFWSRFAAMECGVFDATSDTAPADATVLNEEINNNALDHLAQAEEVCKRFVGKEVDPTQGLLEEISEVRRMLNEGLSTSDMKMVVAAMAHEFLGTGHWYKCKHGHPFTVGECGMPMELARCPACGAGIGGQDHRPAEGVEAAEDIEREFGALRV
ncbi:hypothetical protein LTS10_007957 [Elasticomyces elasticus]|nr:hypothetical protein LTS10_007957 [Elasticomyces elasticus]